MAQILSKSKVWNVNRTCFPSLYLRSINLLIKRQLYFLHRIDISKPKPYGINNIYKYIYNINLTYKNKPIIFAANLDD
jgi:hypothetical protein